jgi:hypothetical protein
MVPRAVRVDLPFAAARTFVTGDFGPEAFVTVMPYGASASGTLLHQIRSCFRTASTTGLVNATSSSAAWTKAWYFALADAAAAAFARRLATIARIWTTVYVVPTTFHEEGSVDWFACSPACRFVSLVCCFAFVAVVPTGGLPLLDVAREPSMGTPPGGGAGRDGSFDPPAC